MLLLCLFTKEVVWSLFNSSHFFTHPAISKSNCLGDTFFMWYKVRSPLPMYAASVAIVGFVILESFFKLV